MNPFDIVVTSVSDPTWTSPDGKIQARTITFNNAAGTQIARETYSKTIAQVGWAGKVIEYTKNNHVYVKQPPQEGYANQQQPQPSLGSSPIDQSTINTFNDNMQALVKLVADLKDYLGTVAGAVKPTPTTTDHVLSPQEETQIEDDIR